MFKTFPKEHSFYFVFQEEEISKYNTLIEKRTQQELDTKKQARSPPTLP